nr:hypothetical protein [Tissierella sp.]
MALGTLAIMYVVIVLVSGLGIAFLYLSKSEKTKNALFYFLAIWAMVIAFMNVTSLPSNYLAQQFIGWGLGFLAVAAIAVKIMKPEKTNIANMLVTASVLFSLIDLIVF